MQSDLVNSCLRREREREYTYYDHRELITYKCGDDGCIPATTVTDPSVQLEVGGEEIPLLAPS